MLSDLAGCSRRPYGPIDLVLRDARLRSLLSMRSIFSLILRRAKPVSKDGRRTRAFFSTPPDCLRQPGRPQSPVCRVGGLDLPVKRAAWGRKKTDNPPPAVGTLARKRPR